MESEPGAVAMRSVPRAVATGLVCGADASIKLQFDDKRTFSAMSYLSHQTAALFTYKAMLIRKSNAVFPKTGPVSRKIGAVFPNKEPMCRSIDSRSLAKQRGAGKL